MEITRLSDSGLSLKTKQANFALISNTSKSSNFDSNLDFVLATDLFQEVEKFGQESRLFSWPGEYEVKSVAVHAIIAEEEGKSLLFVIYADDFKICVLPKLKQELHSDLIEKIGDVDLLIVNAETDEKVLRATIEEIEPKAILPVSANANSTEEDHLITKLGLTKSEAQNKLNIKSKSDLRSDQMGAYLLS
jgi:hypothetical protein